MSIPLACFFAYGQVFYSLWVPNENSQLLYYLSIVAGIDLLLATSVESLYNIFTITNKVKKNSIFNFICSIFTVSTVFLFMNIIDSNSTKLFIISGISTIFGIIRNIIFLPLYSAKILNFKWFTFYIPVIKNVISTSILTCISIVMIKVMNIYSWGGLILLVLITLIIGLIINYFIVLSKHEREIIIRKLKI